MKNPTISYSELIKNFVSEFSNICVVSPDDQENMHQILESVGMKLGKNLVLKYSRRPDLFQSFEESFHKVSIISDLHKKSVIGAVSEVSYYINGIRQNAVYFSDARIKKPVENKARDQVYSWVATVTSEFEKYKVPAYSIILKDNVRVLKKLTSIQGSVLNKSFEYSSGTMLVLPSIYLNSKKINDDFQIVEAAKYENELIDFLSDFQQKSVFSNDILRFRQRLEKEEEFVVVQQGKVKMYFSMYRPKYRSLLIESESKIEMFALNSFKRIMGNKDKTSKYPWVYLSSFVVADDFQPKENVLKIAIQHLLKKGKLKMGELLLTTQKDKRFFPKGKTLLKCPFIVSDGIVFSMNTTKEDKSLKGNIHLNPVEI